LIGADVRDSCGKSVSSETPKAQLRWGRTACGKGVPGEFYLNFFHCNPSWIEEICDTPAELLAGRDTADACVEEAWQAVGGKGADFWNRLKRLLNKKAVAKLSFYVFLFLLWIRYWIEEICDTPAELLASRDTADACVEEAWQAVGGKGADFWNQLKRLLNKKAVAKLSFYVFLLFYEYVIGLKKFATLLPNYWLAETPQTLASRRLGRQSAERERISEINWNVF
jgi:hypothetical protein